MQLEWIINKLLTKDAEYRYQSANDLLVDLKTVDLSGSGHSRRSMSAMSAAQIAAAPAATQKLPMWAYGVIAAALIIGGGLSWMLKPAPTPDNQPAVRFTFDNSAENRLVRTVQRSLAISPDGSLIASTSPGGILLRHSNDIENPNVLANTTSEAADLAFSPTGQSIAFTNTSTGVLMRIDVSGGAPRRIADISMPVRGTNWAEDGYIYMGLRHFGVGRVPSGGGQVEMLIEVENPQGSGRVFGNTFLLPGERFLLYSTQQSGVSWSEAEIWMMDLNTRDSSLLLSGGTDPRYTTSGHLVFFASNTLYAVRLDPSSPKITSDANIFPVMDAVWARAGFNSANVPFAISDNGTLVKLRGVNSADEGAGGVMTWVDSDGNTAELNPDHREYTTADISPDGSRVLLQVGNIFDFAQQEVWLMDSILGTYQVLESPGGSPIWHTDGQHFAFRDGEGTNLLQSSIANPTVVDTLFEGSIFVEPTDWSADGETIILNEGNVGSKTNIGYLDVSSGTRHPFQHIEEDVDYGVLSPDGNWIAYELGDFGTEATIVQRFPDGGDRFVAIEQSSKPVWSPEGDKLYAFRSGRLIEVSVNFETRSTSDEKVLTTIPPYRFSGMAVHPRDGRILYARGQNETLGLAGLEWPPLDVVVNWFSTFPEND